MLSCLKLNPVLHVYIGKGLALEQNASIIALGMHLPLILVTHPLGFF